MLQLNEIGNIVTGTYTLRDLYIDSWDDMSAVTHVGLFETVSPHNDFLNKHGIYSLHEKCPNDFASAKLVLYGRKGVATYALTCVDDVFVFKLVYVTLHDILMAPPELDRYESLPDRFQKTRFIGICATSLNGVIGKRGDNAMLWNEPVELKHFKVTTQNSIIVMGGATYRAIGKPLPNRMNIVLTNGRISSNDGVFTYNSLNDFMENALLNFAEVKRVYVIGGSEIFKLFEDIITDYQISRVPIIADIQSSDAAYMPTINPLLFKAKDVRTLSGAGDSVTVTVQNYKRRSIME